MAIAAEELPEAPGAAGSAPLTVTPMKRVLEVMEANIPDGDWTIADVCERTLAYLDEHEPHVIRVWLRDMGRNTLHEFLRSRQSSERTKWRQQAKSREFGERAAEFQKDGDAKHLSIYDLTYTVSPENIRRKMGDMTGADHMYVSKAYSDSAARQKMLAVFHAKVAEVVGDRRTADVIDEETLTQMFRSITGE